ncbi:hypothetical protein ACGFZS_16285 [Streptomyces sp. NPDC048288]|uniref:hypothetical protein n=1 Tax=Streptomyces sp. NPDC048288 TaxID=3365529 RepID=UPI00371ED0DA
MRTARGSAAAALAMAAAALASTAAAPAPSLPGHLPPDPGHPCAAHPTCTTITSTAGPRPPYRRALGLR